MVQPAEPIEWESWAPPLDPPTAGGLPRPIAERLAADWWATDPHYAAGLMWDWYAGTLDPEPAVSSVNTGVQTVSYDPPAPMGDFGAASRRAAWHFARSRNGAGGLVSIPLGRGEPGRDLLRDMDWWIDP